jgi:hypothetical protein
VEKFVYLVSIGNSGMVQVSALVSVLTAESHGLVPTCHCRGYGMQNYSFEDLGINLDRIMEVQALEFNCTYLCCLTRIQISPDTRIMCKILHVHIVVCCAYSLQCILT